MAAGAKSAAQQGGLPREAGRRPADSQPQTNPPPSHGNLVTDSSDSGVGLAERCAFYL